VQAPRLPDHRTHPHSRSYQVTAEACLRSCSSPG
jgi:hypothetical protein